MCMMLGITMPPMRRPSKPSNKVRRKRPRKRQREQSFTKTCWKNSRGPRMLFHPKSANCSRAYRQPLSPKINISIRSKTRYSSYPSKIVTTWRYWVSTFTMTQALWNTLSGRMTLKVSVVRPSNRQRVTNLTFLLQVSLKHRKGAGHGRSGQKQEWK